MSTSLNRPLHAVEPVPTNETSASSEFVPKSAGGDSLGELKTLRERNVELMSRISKLRADNKELANEASQRSYDGERHAEEIEAIRNREAELTADFTRLTNLSNEHAQQIEEDQRTIRKLQSAIKEEKAVGAYLVRQFDKKADDLRMEAAAATERFMMLEHSLRKEIDQITMKCNDLELAVREREATISQIRSSISLQETQSETVQSELKRKLAKSADESWAKDLEIQRLAANEAVYVNQVTQLNTTIGQKSQQLAKSQEENERFQMKLAALEQDGRLLREKILMETRALETAQAQAADALSKVREETAKELDYLRTENEEFRLKIVMIQDENSALRVENADQRGQVRAAQEEVPRLRQECAEMRNSLRQAQEQATQLRESLSLQQVEAQHSRLEADRQLSLVRSDAVNQLKAIQVENEQSVARVRADAALELKTLGAEHALHLKTQANEFETVKEGFERKIARLGDQFDVERENARSSSMKLMSEISSVRSELVETSAALKTANQEADLKISQFNKMIEELQIQKMRLESRLTDAAAKNKLDFEKSHATEIALRTEVATLATELEKRSRQLSEQGAALKEITEQATQKMERAQDECLELMQEVERLQERLKVQTALNATQKEQLLELTEKRRELEIVRTEVTSQARIINDLKHSTSSKEQQIEKLAEESNRFRTQLEEQAARYSRMSEKTSEKYQAQIETLQASIRQHQMNFEQQRTEMIEQARAMSDVRHTFEKKEQAVHAAQEEAMQLRSELQDQTLRFERNIELAGIKARGESETIQANLRSEIASLQASLQASFEQKDEACETLQKTLAHEREQLELRTKQLAVQSQQIFDRDLAVNDLASQTAAREHQLRHYASALTREKADLMKFSKKIAAEIQMVSATHPLKDYLTATEFELSKVEVQLKTTPVLSPERTRLEAAVTQLIEQREFLKMILGNAQTQFSQQIATLEKMVTAGNFQPVPPPPPLVTKRAAPLAATLAAPMATQPAAGATVHSSVGEKSSVNDSAAAPNLSQDEVRVQWQNPSQDLE